MDLVTSESDSKDEKKWFRLPSDVNANDISFALQILSHWDKQVEETLSWNSKSNPSRTGESMHLENKTLNISQVSGNSNNRSANGTQVIPPPVNSIGSQTHEANRHSQRSFRKEKRDDHGLWDDMTGTSVAVPLAAWALASWAKSSDQNARKILQSDENGTLIKLGAMVPERSVRWNSNTVIKELIKIGKVEEVDKALSSWMDSLLTVLSDSATEKDLPMISLLLDSLENCVQKCDASKRYLSEKGLGILRKIAAKNLHNIGFQVKISNILSQIMSEVEVDGVNRDGVSKTDDGEDEYKAWGMFLLHWIFSKQSNEKLKENAVLIMEKWLKCVGKDSYVFIQAWLTLLLIDLIKESGGAKERSLLYAAFSSPASVLGFDRKNDEKNVNKIDVDMKEENKINSMSNEVLKEQILKQGVLSAVNLARLIIRLPLYYSTQFSENSAQNSNANPKELVNLQFFNDMASSVLTLSELSSSISLPKSKSKQIVRISSEESIKAISRVLKLVAEISSHDIIKQDRILDAGGLFIVQDLLLNENQLRYEIDAEKTEKLGRNKNKLDTDDSFEENIPPVTPNSSFVKVSDAEIMIEEKEEKKKKIEKEEIKGGIVGHLSPHSHMKKHALRLISFLTSHNESWPFISRNLSVLDWLERCAEGKIPGNNDGKSRSYARVALLHISTPALRSHTSSLTPPTHSLKQNFEGHLSDVVYEDGIFLVSPGSYYFKHLSFGKDKTEVNEFPDEMSQAEKLDQVQEEKSDGDGKKRSNFHDLYDFASNFIDSLSIFSIFDGSTKRNIKTNSEIETKDFEKSYNDLYVISTQNGNSASKESEERKDGDFESNSMKSVYENAQFPTPRDNTNAANGLGGSIDLGHYNEKLIDGGDNLVMNDKLCVSTIIKQGIDYEAMPQHESPKSNQKLLTNEKDPLKGCDLKMSETEQTHSDPLNSKEPIMDVVFVHGLRGGPFKTWRVSDHIQMAKRQKHTGNSLVEIDEDEFGIKDTCWPEQWLSKDFPAARMLSVKYKSNLSEWSGATLPLKDVSSILLEKLLACGIGKKPVIFITHSMGGLVVKEMLLRAEGSERYKHFLEKTKGIVFYSCPHFGSKLANMPWGMGFFLRPAPSVDDLRSSSPKLDELNQSLRRHYQKGHISILSFSEARVTPVIETYGNLALRMEIVPIESAYPGFGEIVVLDMDHVNSCKPLSQSDPAYTKTLEFLIKLQESIQKNSK